MQVQRLEYWDSHSSMRT